MRGFTGNFTKQADDHRRYSTALFPVLTDWKETLQFHLHKIAISAARAEKFTCLRTNYSLQTQNSIAIYQVDAMETKFKPFSLLDKVKI